MFCNNGHKLWYYFLSLDLNLNLEYILKLNESSPKLKLKTWTQKTYTLNLFIKSNYEFKSKT
jgi:hypothetical protein